MTGIINYETFLVASILFTMAPGNDTIFILTRSIGQGKKAGVVSVLGVGTGSIFHTLFAAFGLSLILAKSMLVFNLIKYAGAAYLLYLGYKMLTDKSGLNLAGTAENKTVDYRKIYREAFITNILNPKVALFFIAFLPQFIDPTLQNTVVPFIALGATLILTGLVWDLALALFASAIFAKLKDNKKVSAYINKICGLTLVGLGIKVALTDRK
jgi:RhtB (resistance to homoserine/threonine) family protein